mgnify:CR=1 FL=1
MHKSKSDPAKLAQTLRVTVKAKDFFIIMRDSISNDGRHANIWPDNDGKHGNLWLDPRIKIFVE